MDLSTDSQVDFVVSIGDHDSGDNEEMATVAEQNQPDSDGTKPPPSSAVNLVAEGSAGTEATAAATTAAATTATAPTPSQTAGTATTYVTMGVAPGDGDLMPPRFNGDRKTDAEEWLQDFLITWKSERSRKLPPRSCYAPVSPASHASGSRACRRKLTSMK